MPDNAPGLVAATLAALRQHAPFDEMEPAALRFLAARLRLAYFPRGQRIVGPESGVVERLYVLKQGYVRSSGDGADVTLVAGECFPIAALIGRGATVYSYQAERDSFCWELSAEDFSGLVERSPRFHAFCSNHLAVLVERAHRARRTAAEEALIDAAGMLGTLRGAVGRAAVWCAPQTPIGEVLKRMHEARIGSMVIADPGGKPSGIFTLPDVLDRVAVPQTPMTTPVVQLMTHSPVTLEEDATLADAAIAMARHGIRHVVVTRDGSLAGVVSERDLFALQRVSLSRISQSIRAASALEELIACAADVRRLTGHLLAHGVAAEQLTAIVSALNDALSRRLIALAAERHALPARWCWIALGSEGRMEQTFASDQDNALIFAGDAAAKDGLLAFADEVNRGLDACGFPLCKGEIMARNPRWCLSVEQWRGQFDGWIRNPQPEALLNSSIFFDLRPLAGDAALVGMLREGVLEQTRANASFQRAMAQTAVRVRPPLGLVRDFQADEIDLKGHGARPFVDAARVLALARGSAETSTAARLRLAADSAAVEAFHYIQALRLKEGNRLRVAELNDLDRRILKEAFRQSVLLQERLRLDYQL
jgi:CBS domain-containing protein